MAGCFAYLFLADPLSSDDLSFLVNIRDYGGLDENGEIADYYKGITQTWLHRYRYDVARTGNFIAMAMLCLPAWIASTIIAICFAISLWLMTRCARIKPSDFLKFAMLVFLVVFGIMWGDSMFSIMYGFNYVCTTVLFLTTILLFLKNEKNRLWLVAAIGFFTGTWHESFAVVLIAGGFATLILHRDMWRTDRLILLLSVAAGSLLTFTAPAFNHRTAVYSESGIYMIRFLYAWPYMILILLCIICQFNKKWRRLPLEPIVVFGIVSGGLLLIAFQTTRLRCFFPTLVLSCICIPLLLGRMYPKLFCHKKPASMIFGCLLAILSAVHIAAVCHTMSIYRVDLLENQRQLERDARLEQKRSIFTPMHFHYQMTPLALSRPNKRFDSTLYTFKFYFHGAKSQIPEEPESFTYESAEPIPSNIDVRRYKTHLVSRTPLTKWVIEVFINYGDRQERTIAYTGHFIGADGYIYFFISPVRSTISNFLGEPTALTVLFHDKE